MPIYKSVNSNILIIVVLNKYLYILIYFQQQLQYKCTIVVKDSIYKHNRLTRLTTLTYIATFLNKQQQLAQYAIVNNNIYTRSIKPKPKYISSSIERVYTLSKYLHSISLICLYIYIKVKSNIVKNIADNIYYLLLSYIVDNNLCIGIIYIALLSYKSL